MTRRRRLGRPPVASAPEVSRFTRRGRERPRRAVRIIGAFVVIAAVLAACGGPTASIQPAGAAAQLAPTHAAGVPELPAPPADFPGAALLADALPGGATIRVGPFQFYGALYHDATMRLPAQARAPVFASEVPGVGVHLAWRYEGEGVAGPIRESWGPEGNLTSYAGYTSLTPGLQGGRQRGGLELPGAAHAGQRA